MPGMGTGCGQLPLDVAAQAMKAGIEAALRDMPHRPYSWQEAQNGIFSLKAEYLGQSANLI
jgi:O-acetyl-ADP-ribose deacetylase (regulator of RNase III)